jgi:hypothetical protein
VLKFGKPWVVNGIATDATSVTIAVYDDTAALQAVPAGTAMNHDATGQYSFTLATAVPEHAYTATITVVYDGQTYTYKVTEPARVHETPAQASHQAMHDLNRAIAENAAGAMNVSSAAGSVTAHPLDKQILVADRQAAIEARRRGAPGFAVFRIGGDSSR